MIEDAYVGHNTPILADVIYCAIADSSRLVRTRHIGGAALSG